MEDPQLKHRDFFRDLEHPETGVSPYTGHMFNIRGYDSGPRFAAPVLGQHNEHVLKETHKSRICDYYNRIRPYIDKAVENKAETYEYFIKLHDKWEPKTDENQSQSATSDTEGNNQSGTMTG